MDDLVEYSEGMVGKVGAKNAKSLADVKLALATTRCCTPPSFA
ncbi:MAG TPA: hypothetical protein V6D14_08470 [Coleofasciculaceae cyanobacterium]